jgi:hypothetical protein
MHTNQTKDFSEILGFHSGKYDEDDVFWDAAPCSLVEIYQRFRGYSRSFLNHLTKKKLYPSSLIRNTCFWRILLHIVLMLFINILPWFSVLITAQQMFSSLLKISFFVLTNLSHSLFIGQCKATSQPVWTSITGVSLDILLSFPQSLSFKDSDLRSAEHVKLVSTSRSVKCYKTSIVESITINVKQTLARVYLAYLCMHIA